MQFADTTTAHVDTTAQSRALVLILVILATLGGPVMSI